MLGVELSVVIYTTADCTMCRTCVSRWSGRRRSLRGRHDVDLSVAVVLLIEFKVLVD